MTELFDSIATLVITTTFTLEDGTTLAGPSHTDPATVIRWRVYCPDRDNPNQRCNGAMPLAANKVVSMVKNRETDGTLDGQCSGMQKWMMRAGDSTPAMYTCGVGVRYKIRITYQP